MVWNGMEDDFSIFHTGNFLSSYTKNLSFHTPFQREASHSKLMQGAALKRNGTPLS